MRVLIDTSVWVGHFKRRNERLVSMLQDGDVVCHPYVVVEVASGTPPNRRNITAMLAELASSPVATHEELLSLVVRRCLYGRGCGLVDLALIASALMDGNTRIWTLDKRLEAAAQECDVAYRPTAS